MIHEALINVCIQYVLVIELRFSFGYKWIYISFKITVVYSVNFFVVFTSMTSKIKRVSCHDI